VTTGATEAAPGLATLVAGLAAGAALVAGLTFVAVLSRRLISESRQSCGQRKQAGNDQRKQFLHHLEITSSHTG